MIMQDWAARLESESDVSYLEESEPGEGPLGAGTEVAALDGTELEDESSLVPGAALKIATPSARTDSRMILAALW